MQDLDFILERNRECLVKFGLVNFDHQLQFFREVLERIGVEQILRWRELLLEPIYWPNISLGSTDEHWGWKIRPNSWYFKIISEEKIFRLDEKGGIYETPKPWILDGGAYLVDLRQKPDYQANTQQMWAEDENFLGTHLESLRWESMKKLPKDLQYKRIPLSSRFCVDRKIVQGVRILLTQRSEFRSVRLWRSESASEFNFIAQCFPYMPRRWDGETDTEALFDNLEFGGGGGENFLIGGSCNRGGLASISRCFVERLRCIQTLSVRFLGVLELESQT